jgi:hypothetical protein
MKHRLNYGNRMKRMQRKLLAVDSISELSTILLFTDMNTFKLELWFILRKE